MSDLEDRVLAIEIHLGLATTGPTHVVVDGVPTASGVPIDPETGLEVPAAETPAPAPEPETPPVTPSPVPEPSPAPAPPVGAPTLLPGAAQPPDGA